MRSKPGKQSSSAVAARARLASLLRQAGSGDAAAFAVVYTATVRRLRTSVVEVLGESSEVDDTLQEAYLRIWSSAGRFNERVASPMTWMMVIARNLAIDRLRRRRRIFVPVEQEALSIAEPPVDPFEEQDRQIALRRVRAALGALSPERAELITRAYIDGQSRTALGRSYGAPASTIKTWLRRSLAELRDVLEAEADRGAGLAAAVALAKAHA